MNERVPDSSGLPLRAMVMVLLFLGVIFLLVGFQAMSSSDSGDDDTSATTVTTVTTSATPSSKKAAPKADIRVYNISGQEGLAGQTADRLKDAGWTVTETGNMTLTDVSVTTVYYDAKNPGEKESAEAVGKLLHAPVEPRIGDPDVADQPPGVIVVVAS
ncbi:LytR C-terminal domain-containing protein [Mycobacterium sp. pUA109]|uniref:LytR C-terminal domain-containing protein n=1 Tax=Mycobacterium sp. pUA109 TaxID=3238982 RepID=UPI00351B454E